VSRIGKKPVLIKEGVTVNFADGKLTVKGPLGTLTKEIHPDVSLKIEEKQIEVVKKSDNKFHRALFGTVRSVINNMVRGVSEGFMKELHIEGMGYKAEMKGEDLNLIVGYSHPILFKKDESISFSVEGNVRVIVKGIDKERVGEIAAEIRAVRPPEPYKGKGIRYKGERVRRKAGKIAV
jgi:large subunit ribosomal protein L6